MKEEEIYYYGSYDVTTNNIKRKYNLATTNKMDYIIIALNQAGYNVHLISPSYVIEKRYIYDQVRTKYINSLTTLTLLC